jgi:hypothetical protein
MKKLISSLLILGAALSASAAIKFPKFRAQEIDKIEVGYGVQLADVDGDGKTDIVLADKREFAWYQNPSWKKHILTGHLTERDHVCVAARDIDGDGKAEIAVGAQWNPGETTDEEKSGAVFYLIPPDDRTKKWTPVKLKHEPTVHRMDWARVPGGDYNLIVAPLHGRGNKGGAGKGARIMGYEVPSDPKGDWSRYTIDESFHKTHNFDVVRPGEGASIDYDIIAIAGAEGLAFIVYEDGAVKRMAPIGHEAGDPSHLGMGEIRAGNMTANDKYGVSVEPIHGNQLVIYRKAAEGSGGGPIVRDVLFDGMADGHALATGDLLGTGMDQIVVGWRGNRRHPKNIGIRLYAPVDDAGEAWEFTTVDKEGMACEDLKIADLNGDGRPDIVACGRATKNVKIYWNEGRE